MKKQVKLHRALGLWETTLSGIGIIFGAGIYVLIGKAAGIAGTSVWLSFLLAALVAGLTGLSYAELASMYPKASAEYEYSKKAFGKRTGFLVGWLALVAGIVSAATVAIGFGGYLNALTGFPVEWLSVAVIVVCSFIVFLGIRQSAWIAILFTLIEAAGLVFIIFVGLPLIGKIDLLDFSGFNLSSVFEASALIFFAFIGFEEIVRMSEETRNPKKTIPTALVIAIIVSTVFYVLVAVSSIAVLGVEKLSASKAPLAEVAFSVLGENAFFALAVIALFSTFNTVLLILLASSRLAYGIGADKELPEIVSKIHSKTKTPWIAIIIIMLVASVLAFAGDISLVANATDFVLFAVFIAINAGVIMLRYREPKLKRAFRVPGEINGFAVLPALGILANIVLAVHISFEIILVMLGMIALGLGYFEVAKKIGLNR